MFMFDRSYVADILAVPGGLADLIGRFLTQFFLYAWVGSAIVALLLSSIFLLSLRTARQGWFGGLSLLPAFALWVFFCDENALIGAIVALMLALLADWALSAIAHRVARLSLRVVSAPLLYWLMGPLAIVAGLLGLISALRQRDKWDVLAALGAIILIVLMPLAAQYCLAIPLDRLYLSPHYFRDLMVVPASLWVAAALTIVVPLLPATASNKFMSVAICIVTLSAGGWAVGKNYNAASENVMAYDFMARFQQWNRIIDASKKKAPRNSISCTALNLALGMKGQLANHLLDYPQNGLMGLLPEFSRDPISPLTTGEAYYQLGLVNTAQQFVFEAQESIQDCQKSSRCYMRLAETNLIMGSYEVSRKYLLALQKTMFYKDWAEQRLQLLDDETAIEQHSDYGRLRQMLPQEDHLFMESDVPTMLGLQLMANNANQLAYEYAQAVMILSQQQRQRQR